MGLFPTVTYDSFETRLDPGDVLVLFSDGVTEAMNHAEDEFGEERLTEVVRLNKHRTAQEIVQAITGSLAVFVGGAPTADDVTLVVLKKT